MPADLKELTADVVANFVQCNSIAADDLPGLIRSVYDALGSVGQLEEHSPEPSAKATAAQIRKSITPDALTSFIDGRPYKMLRRHLAANGMTPADYRTKYGLPKDYPLTSAVYSAKRSDFALARGLGRRPASAPAPAPQAAAKPAKKRRPKSE
jgi:predicted transcriptional regulator